MLALPCAFSSAHLACIAFVVPRSGDALCCDIFACFRLCVQLTSHRMRDVCGEIAWERVTPSERLQPPPEPGYRATPSRRALRENTSHFVRVSHAVSDTSRLGAWLEVKGDVTFVGLRAACKVETSTARHIMNIAALLGNDSLCEAGSCSTVHSDGAQSLRHASANSSSF